LGGFQLKFFIEKNELSALTTLVYRAASSKNTIPVLSGLLIEVSKDKGLTMTATDMEIGIRASTDQVQIEKEGSVLVNAYYFADFIKLLPESTIGIELNQETARLNINYGRSSGYINIYQDQEYPGLPIEHMEHRFSLPQNILKEALRKTSFATAVTHFRQVFTGVLFDVLAEGKLKIVASDTHRLAYYSYSLPQKDLAPFNFIIPTRTVNELTRLLDDDEDTIDISFSDNNVIFTKDNILLMSRLIEGQYPNYEQVIPKQFSTNLSINTSILTTTLERARTMPTDEKIKIHSVQFLLSENEITVNAFSEAMGEIKEVIEDFEISGDIDFRIAFNTNYFLDVMKIFAGETDKVNLNMSGSLGPALITNPEKDYYLYVLVPLRTSQ
jgi:DNA polymerase-3 subunit beta